MLSLNAIDTNEVLRYLGMKHERADDKTIALIHECEQLLIKTMKPRYIMNCFDIQIADNVLLVDTNMVLQGQAIKTHLKDCEKVVLFCMTLSAEVDRLIRQTQIVDLTKGIILDCCASTAVEQLCDIIEECIVEEYRWTPQNMTTRFSPGYGDLPIAVQGSFLNLLDAPRKIGLYASQNHILTPRKSVTAIVGLSRFQQNHPVRKCESCGMNQTCQFRLRGEQCGI